MQRRKAQRMITVVWPDASREQDQNQWQWDEMR